MSQKSQIIIFLGTYPPRECGIATFTQDLLYYSQKLLGRRALCRVAALNLTSLDTYKYPPEVAWEIDQNNKDEYISFAQTVNENAAITGIIIQHEYGIFGGVDGEDILSFMQYCKKPMIVTLHTVLPNPSEKMKEITTDIIKYAYTLVVLTQNSKEIIENLYPQARGKILVVPHGIHYSTFSTTTKFKSKLELDNHIILSTFGLLSRGKGIEYMLRALPKIIEKYPSVLYLILGETHPVVRRIEGEKYRIELSDLVTKLGLEKQVRFYDQYLNLPDLLEFLKATDIYISTSTNPNQAVSGTLSYALGSGRAVVSTNFAQATEIVSMQTGRLVPIRNSQALTAALLDLLSNEKRLKQMHLEAYKKTRPMLWSNVAKQYIDLLANTKVPLIKITHLLRMTDDFGLFQFASLNDPNKDFGYTLDDNARALIACSWLITQNYTKELEALIRIYLKFIETCQLKEKNGSFINYIRFQDRIPTIQNKEEDLEDSQARALWALSEIMCNATIPQAMRKKAKRMFITALAKGSQLTHLRARAFTIKSFALAQTVLPEKRAMLLAHIHNHADFLLHALNEKSSKSWFWFEENLNYNNALLSESLLIAGNITSNPAYTEKGIRSLRFLISKTFSSNMYMPIGHSQWYKNNKKRSDYDQQPEDPASMIIALVAAFIYTGDEMYKNLAKTCFSWFLGNNSLKKSLYDDDTGGCYDGIHPDRINQNQGAESLISYLMANILITKLK